MNRLSFVPSAVSPASSAPEQSEEKPAISVVIPCHNEMDGLSVLHERLTSVLVSLKCAYEVVLVDDGSKDETWSVLEQLSQRDPRLVCARLSRNHGHQLALTAGLSLARGERIVILDADLQDPPELLPQMLEVMDRGYDVVYGQRNSRAGESIPKRATAAMFYRLVNVLSDVPIPRDTGDFRLLSRRALDILLAMPERHRFIRGMVSWIGLPQASFQYDRAARYAGRSSYPFRKMLGFAFDAITGFSIKPLRIASWVGLLSALLALGLVGYSIYSWLFLDAVVGWTSVMAGVAFFSSIQLLVLGIIGEYLGRLYDQSKQRPLFIIDRVVRAASRRSGVATGG